MVCRLICQEKKHASSLGRVEQKQTCAVVHISPGQSSEHAGFHLVLYPVSLCSPVQSHFLCVSMIKTICNSSIPLASQQCQIDFVEKGWDFLQIPGIRGRACRNEGHEMILEAVVLLPCIQWSPVSCGFESKNVCFLIITLSPVVIVVTVSHFFLTLTKSLTEIP